MRPRSSLSAAVAIRYPAAMSIDPVERRNLFLFAILFEGGLAVLAVGLGWLLKQNPLQTFRWDLAAAKLGAATAVPMLLVFILCTHWPVGPLARIRTFTEEVVRPLFGACSVLELAAICTLAGFGEEMLFRGVAQPVLERWLGAWGSVAATNVIFGIMHLITPTYAVLAGLMGAYLSCLWMGCQNLLVVIVAHALYDFLALLYLTRSRRL